MSIERDRDDGRSQRTAQHSPDDGDVLDDNGEC